MHATLHWYNLSIATVNSVFDLCIVTTVYSFISSAYNLQATIRLLKVSHTSLMNIKHKLGLIRHCFEELNR